MNRRDFIKNTATASAASIAGMSMPSSLMAAPKEEWQWDKSVCRFYGTGCGIMMTKKDGKTVAIRGDPTAPVSRGLNCTEGCFNAEIMYGEDHPVMPLFRVNSKEEFDKKGKFQQVSWQRAFDEVEKQFKRAYSELGVTGVGTFGNGQYTIQGGYVSVELAKAGSRTNNTNPNTRHYMASTVVGLIQAFGVGEPSGCYDDIGLTDTTIT